MLIGFTNFEITNLVWQTTPSIKNIGEISLILFFAFQGGESALSVSGEVRNPQKTIPKAIRASILIVLTLYILIQTVAQGVLGDSLGSFRDNPLGEVANLVIGPIGFTLLTLGAAASMFGTLSSEVLGIPRVLFGAAKDNTIPFKKLASIHEKYATPYVAIIAYVSLGFIFASIGGFQQLAILSSASVLLIYLGVSLAVIKLRNVNKSNLKLQTFKIPGGLTVPILSSFVILWFLSNLTKNELSVMFISMVILSVIYFLLNFLKNKK